MKIKSSMHCTKKKEVILSLIAWTYVRYEKFIVRNFKFDLKSTFENFWIGLVIRAITQHNFRFCHIALFDFMEEAHESVYEKGNLDVIISYSI